VNFYFQLVGRECFWSNAQSDSGLLNTLVALPPSSRACCCSVFEFRVKVRGE
jgi:hypothetical protein